MENGQDADAYIVKVGVGMFVQPWPVIFYNIILEFKMLFFPKKPSDNTKSSCLQHISNNNNINLATYNY